MEERFLDAQAAGGLGAGIDPGALARYVATLAGGLAVEAQSGATRQQLHAAIDVAMTAFPG